MDSVAFFVHVDYHRAVGVDFRRYTQLLSHVLEARSVLLQFALSRRLFRGRRMQSGILYSRQFSFNWFTPWMWYVAEYSPSESSLLSWLVFVECLLYLFVGTFVSTLYNVDSSHIGL